MTLFGVIFRAFGTKDLFDECVFKRTGNTSAKQLVAARIGRKQRKTTVKYDKRRNRIEIMFGRLKDWRRVATRYDRCPKVFLSAIALAAVVVYWL